MMTQDSASIREVTLVGGRSVVTRQGNTVFREALPWSATILALLKHLEREGFEHAPRAIGNGFDEQGREALTFVEGECIHPYPWPDSALPVIGEMLRKLHVATASFVAPHGAKWSPWFGRSLGTPSVIGHCDAGPWNIIHRSNRPVALIDWEEAGPVDPLVELAQACWLNAQLHDDDLAEMYDLGSVEARGRQVKLLLDGYGLPRSQREGFMGLLRDFVTLNAANEAIQAKITPETTDATALWAITWRARGAAWIQRNQEALERAVLATR